MSSFKLNLTIAEKLVLKRIIRNEILQCQINIKKGFDLEFQKDIMKNFEIIYEKIKNASSEQSGTLVNSIGRFENFQYSACMNESETEISFQLSTDKWRELEDSDVWTELLAYISEISKP